MDDYLSHVGLSVRDLDRSIRFYTEQLGMTLAGPIISFGGEEFARIMALERPTGRLAIVVHPGIRLELFEFDSPRPVPRHEDHSVADHGFTHFGIQVEDIDGMYQRLRAAGVRFHCPVLEFTDGVRATYGRDPDGNVFELLGSG